MKKSLLALTCAALLSVSACSMMSEPIYNAKTVMPQTYSAQTMEKAITEACIDRGWVVTETAPGLVRAQLNLRTHEAVVDIAYTDQQYSFQYVSSKNLNEKNGEIHNKYNHWINNLDYDIRRNLMRADSGRL